MKFLRVSLSILIASILAATFSLQFPEPEPVGAVEYSGTTTENLGSRRGVSMALGNSGEPYAVYCISATTNPVAPAGLGFAYRRDADHNLDTENWIHQSISIFESGENCSQTRLIFKKVNNSRYLHLATMVDSGTTSKVIYGVLNLDTGGWSLEEVESGAASRFSNLAITIRSDNEPRLSYFDRLSANRDLRYAARTAGAWAVQTLVTEGIAGASSSIDVDTGDNVHIIFSQTISTPTLSYPNFVHTWQAGETWSSETIENDPNGYNSGGNYSLKILPDNSLRVAYAHAVYSGITLLSTSIRYASRINGEWSEETLVTYNGSGTTITQVILAMNGEIPGIVYGMHPGGIYAETSIYLWTKSADWAVVGLGQNFIPTSLAYDRTDQVHLSSYTNNQGAVNIYYGFRRLLYPIHGQVTNRAGQAVEGVTIQDAWSTTQVVSNAAGEFTINLEAGRQTLLASKDGAGFLQERVTIPNVKTYAGTVHFTTSDYGPNPAPFLSPPVLSYTGTQPEAFLQDTDVKPGRLSSWFDHNLPVGGNNPKLPLNELYSVKDPGISYKYRYHNGLDIVNDPTMFGNAEKIFAAVDGIIVKIIPNHSIFGNHVIMMHMVGDTSPLVYFTLYAHLESFNPTLQEGHPVDRDNPDQYIGIMGTTGNSTNVHLHFGVYRDDGDGVFTQLSNEKPVDPFGWLRSDEDPSVAAGGAPSVNLWLHLAESSAEALPGEYLVLTSGELHVNVLPGFFTGPARLTSTRIIGPIPDTLRSLGLTYLLDLLNGYQNPVEDTGFMPVQTGQKAASGLMSVSLTYDPADLAHLDQTNLMVMRWNETAYTWVPLLSSIDADLHSVTANVDEFGIFDLQAPLICAGDELEVNDSPESATPLMIGQSVPGQVFDLVEDEDWYSFDLQAGQMVDLEITNLSAGVEPTLQWLDSNQQILVSGTNELFWVAPVDGRYFLRLTNAGDFGCSAGYSIQNNPLLKVFLPLLVR